MAQGERPADHRRHTSRLSTLSAGSATARAIKRESVSTNSVTDEATIAYIKRTLCHDPVEAAPLTGSTVDELGERSLDELLPPLTSANDVDIQLYAIIAVILDQFVQKWYNRITPDSDFTGEVVRIIAHCTRGLEERLRLLDLEALLLDELPALCDSHIDAVKTARSIVHSKGEPNDYQQARLVYHLLRPKSALSPPPLDDVSSLTQHENEVDWSQLLVTSILPLVLPPEDFANPCLSVLVSEILAEMIVCNAIVGKSSEPWLLWEGVTKAIYALRPSVRPPNMSPDSSPMNRLEHYGLLSSAAEARRYTSGSTDRHRFDSLVLAFWMLLQYTVVAWSLLRALGTALMHASSIQPRTGQARKDPETARKRRTGAESAASLPSVAASVQTRPVVTMRIWDCVGKLISLPQRMPWLVGCLSLLQWFSLNGPGQVCRTNSALDRLLSAQIHEKLFDPALVPRALHAIRGAVFPDNALAPARVPPTSDEVVEIKRECARAIVEVVPEPVRLLYFATKDEQMMTEDVERTLELFSDQYLNKHLIVSALELVVVRLFPELAEADNDA